MSKTPKELDAAVKLIFAYRPPRFGGGPPDAEAPPDEDESEKNLKPVERRTRERRKMPLKGVSRLRHLMRRRSTRKA